MNIIQTCIRYPPATGGAEEYVKNISEELVRRGHMVTVYTSTLKNQWTGERLEQVPEMIHGVRVIRCMTLHWKKFPYPVLPALPLRLLFKKADIIHAHGMFSFPADCATIIAKIRRLPLVITPWFFEIKKKIGGIDLNKIYLKSIGAMMMHAQCVVIGAPFERKVHTQHGLHAENYAIIPPGIQQKEFAAVRHNVYQRYELTNHTKKILFVGRLEEDKGVEILIKAIPHIIKKIKNIRVIIVGPDFGKKQELERLSKELHVEQYVLFTGRLSREDLLSAYKNADVFCLPSRYELFGIVLIEAMAAQIPIVAAHTTAIPDVVTHQKTGLLFPVNNAKKCADYIIQLVTDKHLKETLVKNAYRKIQEKYTLKKTVDMLEEVYREVISITERR